MDGRLSKEDWNSWLELKFKELAERNGWEGPQRETAKSAFFEGANVDGLYVGKKVLGEVYDRRIKLTKKQKADIMYAWNSGESQKSLAIKYGVSQATIYYAVHPDKYERMKKTTREWMAEHGPYDKKSALQTYRYKRRLVLKGLL